MNDLSGLSVDELAEKVRKAIWGDGEAEDATDELVRRASERDQLVSNEDWVSYRQIMAERDQAVQNTLTPEEASTTLTGLAYWNGCDPEGKDAPLVAKLERIAGNTPTSIRATLDGETT